MKAQCMICKKPAIMHLCNACHIRFHRKPKKKPELEPKLVAKVRKLRKTNMTNVEISYALDVNMTTLGDIIRRLNLPRRRPGGIR
ncbi:MAG: hypothetical protein KGH67_01545 [Candidatus Micrarchaeota archaeon]|nr:hypothetical protein [Candidatus Micrarchaeota archaeon]MDE1859190.1 hypothetical protein [Candidatus Micrarchaeota archaeon]